MLSGHDLKSMAVITLVETELVYSELKEELFPLRDGSFFSKSKLTLQKWMLAIPWWSREYPVTDMAMEVEITERSACDI